MKPNSKLLSKNIELIKTILVPEERKDLLKPLISHLQSKINANKDTNINFICTHNSRRSHLAQVWFITLAHHFKLHSVYSYSGGTIAAAVAKPIIETLKKQGFGIETLKKTNPPLYSIKYSRNEPEIICFSKIFSHPFNPQKDFISVMVCSEAYENCPIIPITEKRFPVPYQDPKLFDNTDQQDEKYLERSLQIASEMYFVFSGLEF